MNVRQNDIEIINNTILLFTEIEELARKQHGNVPLRKHITSRGFEYPYTAIITQLKVDGFFKMKGSKRVPNYYDFKKLDRIDVRRAMDEIKDGVKSSINIKSVETVDLPMPVVATPVVEEVVKKVTVRKSSELYSDAKLVSVIKFVKVKVFGITIFEKQSN